MAVDNVDNSWEELEVFEKPGNSHRAQEGEAFSG